MLKSQTYNTPQHFESLFRILSSNRFLNKEGLGGELPFFIHSFPVNEQSLVDTNIQSLIKRLQNEGIDILEIHLYQICIYILKKENLFEQIVNQEKNLPKQRLLRVLSGPLNIENAILPEINRRLRLAEHKTIFITGVGAVYPFLRLHSIINNIQTLEKDPSIVMFYPGAYDKKTLTLFGHINDGNDYRAHNLNDYKI